MKTKNLIIAMTLVAICMSTGTLLAQSNLKLRATVPFNFVAEDRTLPAGEYEVTQIQPNLLVLRNVDIHFSAIERTESNDTTMSTGKNALVFQHIGSTYFLQVVEAPSFGSKHKLEVSSTQKVWARMNPRPKPELVVIAAR